MKQIVTVQKIKRCGECPHFKTTHWGNSEYYHDSFQCKRKGNKSIYNTVHNMATYNVMNIIDSLTIPSWCLLDEFKIKG